MFSIFVFKKSVSLTFFDGFSGAIRETLPNFIAPKRHVSQTASRDDKSLTFTKKQAFSLVWRRDETRPERTFRRTHSRSLVKLAALCRCATKTNSSSLCAKTHSSSVQSCETTCCMFFLPSSCYITTPNLVLASEFFSEEFYMDSALFVRFCFRVEHDKELRKAFSGSFVFVLSLRHFCRCLHSRASLCNVSIFTHQGQLSPVRIISLVPKNRFLTSPKRLRHFLGSLARVYNRRYKFSVYW